ncbi:MAG: hypothetical protein ACREID_03915 [Planctomycetota bacterium]
MDRVTLLTSLTRQTACPDCGAKRLEFLLRCDLEYGGCLYTAHCRACGMNFEIAAGSGEPAAEDLRGVAAPCPQCGETDRTATLHCELETRACVYTLACARCGAS